MPDIWWVVAGYYALAVLSAVLPWVNAEVIMLSAVPLAGSPLQLGALVSVVTAGQMTGKAIMYWIARRTTRPHGPRVQQFLERWQERIRRRPHSALGVTFVSSTLGIPPFYLVTMAAGALNVAFNRFLAVGTVGRLIHFGAVAFAAGTIVHAASGPAEVNPPAVIERLLQSEGPELTSYAARRLLTVSTMGGRMQAQLEAWTYLDSDGTFRFDIIRQEGSELLRQRVLVAALETEQRTRDPRQQASIALTRANYEFEVAGAATADGLVAIRLVPRRRTPMLLEGSVLARQDSGDLVRIDGRLSEPPSWWTRRVDIVLRYSRIRGVRVPIEMVSRADVRVAGTASFSMTYHYTRINGRVVDARP